MAVKRTTRKKKKIGKTQQFFVVCIFTLVVAVATGFGVYHIVRAAHRIEALRMPLDPNLGLQARVEEFFTANDAPEMIPIIGCESEFKHFNQSGSVLQNKAGSSAIGIAQILSSQHPDPKVLKVFNIRHNTNLTIDDFDLDTIEGNLGYALVLYQVRGTKDWECAKKFRFH